jgi:hypothetical protein
MKHLLVFALLLAVSIASAQIHFTAILTGADEVPAVTTSANGTGSFSLNETRTELTYVITYQGLSGTLTAGGHFHLGTPGRNGSVIRNTAASGDPSSNTVSGIWKASDATQPLTPALVESRLCKLPHRGKSWRRDSWTGQSCDGAAFHRRPRRFPGSACGGNDSGSDGVHHSEPRSLHC